MICNYCNHHYQTQAGHIILRLKRLLRIINEKNQEFKSRLFYIWKEKYEILQNKNLNSDELFKLKNENYNLNAKINEISNNSLTASSLLAERALNR
jgi:hypothetical protein